jgi:hypothetical protein
MYKLFDKVCCTIDELIFTLNIEHWTLNFWSSEGHCACTFGRVVTKVMERSDITLWLPSTKDQCLVRPKNQRNIFSKHTS